MNKTLMIYNFDIDDNLVFADTKIYGYERTLSSINLDGITKEDVKELLEKGHIKERAFSTEEFAVAKNNKTDYYFDNSVAFEDFRDFGKKGQSVFIDDMRVAIKAGKFAPSWEDFKECLRNGSLFSFITARGHEPHTFRLLSEAVIFNSDINNEGLTSDEFYNLIEILKEYHIKNLTEKGLDINNENLIRAYLDDCEFMGVSSQSFADKFTGGELKSPQYPSEFKEMFLKDFFLRCNKIANKHNLKLKFGLSDDDIDNTEAITDLFKLLKKQYEHVTFAVYDTNKYKETKYME